MRFSTAWARERVWAERVAEAVGVERVVEDLPEAVAGTDGAFVLDMWGEYHREQALPFLEQGKSVFVDKVPSLCVDKTRELAALAQAEGVHLAAWSQLLFAVEAEPFRGVQGGAGLVTFCLPRENLRGYAVHLVCSAMAAFGVDPASMTRIDTGPDGVPPGPDRPEWNAYLGTYDITLVDRVIDRPTLRRANGWLWFDDERLVAELEPGLFFTLRGEALDLRSEPPTWRNIPLQRR